MYTLANFEREGTPRLVFSFLGKKQKNEKTKSENWYAKKHVSWHLNNFYPKTRKLKTRCGGLGEFAPDGRTQEKWDASS